MTASTIAASGSARQQAFLDGLCQLLSAVAKQSGLALALEDWHWADEASDAALVHFVRSTAGHPILVLVDHRPYSRSIRTWEPSCNEYPPPRM